MSEKSLSDISLDGLWNNNPALVQLLGLCPLLAVTGSVVNALGLGLATMMVLVGSNFSVSLIRNHVSDAVRLPAFVMIIASFVTVAELVMQAFTYELYEVLGIFIPLIVTNCAILGRADAFACKNPILPSVVDGFMMAMGFTVVLVILGAMREIIGQGVVFSNMDLLFGPSAAHWKIELISGYPDFLFAILPPGAFVAMGLLIAGKNIIDARIKRRAEAQKVPVQAGAKRARVTGKIS
ncbi:MAG: electron transport complex subunit E [Thalassolituus sp.]|jgi:electron transport complex protein RnfE|uniref:Ion-translocating oxidoreductase complex subunit E n=1 Tax=Thalassolituus oleivorans MIL-1 TaxID=1298593 RepID=M5DQN8_9GAMM|nr:electron transport complex subunit E [Thalassolituus oleivorans]PCI47018.1 MAG: electron transport complex subunit RsxE [Oceanospirillales bacterium]MBQ0726053.1 electron transport complex subunit E [Thalassolituus oleivorans]MCA6129482.1 electron transporter RnfE [Thalassolituus oleivorans 4BN06-13]MDF1641314.1 electron transport complex subunit E [Thalassolituus oleivorans]CCU71823.1 NADH-ubiquinone oxidoreductase [Thalassolituus oleivorans MIL-1]|tara:strand:+ start:221 stop:934 length:714 start_codon:yes stop_codon:yes gene_type:complete